MRNNYLICGAKNVSYNYLIFVLILMSEIGVILREAFEEREIPISLHVESEIPPRRTRLQLHALPT